MTSLRYYLDRSAHGDRTAAYEAAKIMYVQKYSEVMIQAQLRRAASLGSADAMRWLGFLGLCGKLITPESTVSDVTCYSTYDPAYQYFASASLQGDTLSTLALGICTHYGMGTQQDPPKAQAIMTGISHDVPADAIVPIVFLINALHASENSMSDLGFLRILADSQGGQYGEDREA